MTETRNILADGTYAGGVSTVLPTGIKFNNPGRSEGQKVRTALSDSLVAPTQAPSSEVEISELVAQNPEMVPEVEAPAPPSAPQASNTVASLAPKPIEGADIEAQEASQAAADAAVDEIDVPF